MGYLVTGEIFENMLQSKGFGLYFDLYTANNTGDSTPPCLTPFMTVKDSDITLPHLTFNVWFVYINNNYLKTKGYISRFNNPLKSLN